MPPKKEDRKPTPRGGLPGDSEPDNDTQPALKNAVGSVMKSGRFRCGMLKNGSPCGSKMANAGHNISSHLSKIHKPNSAYLQKQAPKSDLRCCGRKYANLNSFRTHRRRKHKGAEDGTGNQEKSPQDHAADEAASKGKEDESSDEGDNSPPDRPDRGPKPRRDDDDEDHGGAPVAQTMPMIDLAMIDPALLNESSHLPLSAS
ncbi:hypothetical protein GGS23DRAFT_616378 [Durotheca rogersii]|uniref:uncharacterized protein n=1 Tax=Durotheca rogersii TaxID=419775 RepID=UPI00221E9975|nr:uncharacterized protein GGS23DRAFT_616378 [Durotheca rogersii]KAI5859267.1 hypothetical protein GGS23DRAFT_616378 [Durotheca rogersii]